MTAEVEALLARLDDISSRSGHEWNAAKDAAVLIRAQVEEITKQRSTADRELDKERQANTSANRALATLGGKIHELERQLATVTQAERERCVLELNKCYYQNDSSCAEHDVWNAAIATCIDAIDALVPSAAKKECSWPKCGCIESLKGRECRALAPRAKQEQDPGESAITLPDLTTRMYSHAGKEPGAAQTDNDGANLGASGSNPHTAPASGQDGEDCTGELEEQLIEAILVEKSELNRLRTVAEAAKAFIHSEGRENIVAAELALVNAIEQSYS
jgi:hypothetical protein